MYNEVNYRFKIYKKAICYVDTACEPLLLRAGREQTGMLAGEVLCGIYGYVMTISPFKGN